MNDAAILALIEVVREEGYSSLIFPTDAGAIAFGRAIIDEFRSELASALCSDCENGVKSLNIAAHEKFRKEFPELNALMLGN